MGRVLLNLPDSLHFKKFGETLLLPFLLFSLSDLIIIFLLSIQPQAVHRVRPIPHQVAGFYDFLSHLCWTKPCYLLPYIY